VATPSGLDLGKAALRQGARKGRQHLSGFQNRLAKELSGCAPLDVPVDSDSGVVIFRSVSEAVLCGERVFRSMFDAPTTIWMRGVIVGCPGIVDASELTGERTHSGVTIRSPAPALLDALVAEKAGSRVSGCAYRRLCSAEAFVGN
jgi:hypothetical protein